MGKGPQSQLTFLLYYCIALMRNVFRLKYKKSSSGEIRVPNKRYHINYINPLLLFLSVYIVEIST